MTFQPILKQGMGFIRSQNMMGMMMRMIGCMPVKSALKYSVVPVSLTIPKLVIKQSNDKKTLAVYPTVYTG